MSPSAANLNIARHLLAMAAAQPDIAALKIPRGRTAAGEIDYLTLTFDELASEVAAWQSRLTVAGVRPGDRTLVMVRPGLPLIAAVFALFTLGAVPVVIDPGMGLKHFLGCVVHARPRVLVGIPFARLLSRLFRRTFSSVKIRVAAANSLTARLASQQAQKLKLEAIAPCSATELAAILFTSGSTGAPKGVCYEHGHFDAQVRLIRETYDIRPGEIDLPLLPIFALFNPALGMTTIIPELDPRRPATLNAAKIVQAIRQENVTNSFGSPTLWRKIGDHCLARGITLPTLRRVLCAGAPVPARLWEISPEILPRGQLHSPYGATEALPVTSISADEIKMVRGPGACVGRPVSEIEIKIIVPVEGAIESMADMRELPRGEIGEIVVRGPVVTNSYDALPAATALAKIKTTGGDAPAVKAAAGQFETPDSNPSPNPNSKTAAGTAGIWHRMGDCGYLDLDGRLWFCGRKAERIETVYGVLYTEPCEQIFRGHPAVARCALVGLGPRGLQEPALAIELTASTPVSDRAGLARELREIAARNAATARIEKIFFHPGFPVDVRHNAKIHRLTLAKWATSARSW